ncbi:hypothetical protein F5Y14DRAFT_417229, partial [Nemania sp. NC0429]
MPCRAIYDMGCAARAWCFFFFFFSPFFLQNTVLIPYPVVPDSYPPLSPTAPAESSLMCTLLPSHPFPSPLQQSL